MSGRAESKRRDERRSRPKPEKAKSWKILPDFACRLVFSNALPPPPSGPFLEEEELDLSKFVPYKTTTLESSYKWDLHSNGDLGLEIDLVDPKAYTAAGGQLAPEDQQIVSYTKGKSAVATRADVSWLVKGTHTHNNLYKNVHKFKGETDALNQDFGDVNNVENWEEQNVGEAKEEKEEAIHTVEYIEKRFLEAREPPKYPGSSNLKATSVVPLLPDQGNWAHSFQNVVIDDDPNEFIENRGEQGPAAKRRRLSHAVLLNAKTVEDKFGRGNFYGEVFVPDEVSDEMEYAHVRDYIFSVKDFDISHVVCRIDENRKEATYCEVPKKMIFTRGRNPKVRNRVVLSRRPPNDAEDIRRRGLEATLRLHGRDWEQDQFAAEELDAEEEEDENEANADAAIGNGASTEMRGGQTLFSREGDEEDEEEDEDYDEGDGDNGDESAGDGREEEDGDEGDKQEDVLEDADDEDDDEEDKDEDEDET